MRRPYKATITGGTFGTKAVGVQDVDNFLDWLITGGDGTEPQDLYKAVAWVFWCVNRRANAVAGMPYLILPLESEEDDPEQAVEFGVDLHQTLWTIEAWLALKAQAFVLKRQAPELKLQVLNTNTMKVKEFDADGPLTFEQSAGGQTQIFSKEELLYFRTWNPRDDINAGIAAGQAGQTSAGLVKNANDYAAAYFENGAIPAVILTAEGNVPETEAKRVRSAWEKVTQGIKRAWSTMVLGHGLTPTIIGQPIGDLAMPDLDKSQREQILAAYLLPPGLAEPKTNSAEHDAQKQEAYEECYIPECETWIEPVLNRDLFNPLGLRLSFQYHEIEVLQAKELAKAEASSFVVSGIMLPAYKENTVSVDEVRRVVDSVLLAANLPPLDATFTPEERTPPQLLQPGEEPGEEEDDKIEGGPTPADERIESRLPKSLPKSAVPKVSAPPRWGHHRVSLPN